MIFFFFFKSIVTLKMEEKLTPVSDRGRPCDCNGLNIDLKIPLTCHINCMGSITGNAPVA